MLGAHEWRLTVYQLYTQSDILFARYVADNLAVLDYKTLEELYIVIGELRTILSVAGMQVLYMAQQFSGADPNAQSSQSSGEPNPEVRTACMHPFAGYTLTSFFNLPFLVSI